MENVTDKQIYFSDNNSIDTKSKWDIHKTRILEFEYIFWPKIKKSLNI